MEDFKDSGSSDSLDLLESLNKEFGGGDLFKWGFDKDVVIDDVALDNLKDVAEQTPSGIKKEEVVFEEVPEFIKPYKEVYETSLGEITPDTTNYTQKAVQEFGEQFAGVSSKDEFEEILFKKNREEEYLRKVNQQYSTLKEYMNKPDIDILKEDIRAKSRDLVHVPEVFEQILKAHVNEDGSLTAEGSVRVREIKSQIEGAIKNAHADAKTHAQREYSTHKAWQQAIPQAIDKVDFGGVKVSEELKLHIDSYIKSGQLDEALSGKGDKSALDTAEKDVWMAIALNPQFRNRLIYELFKRGEDQGVNSKAKKLFK